MLYVIVYDIIDDNLRRLVAETLKDYGLERIQKSVFMGILKKYNLRSLLTNLSKVVFVDSILIFPLCDSDFTNMMSIGQKFMKEIKKQVEFY